MNGKLIWGKLKITKIQWDGTIGRICIHMPILHYVPLNQFTHSLVKNAIINKFTQLKWPFDDMRDLCITYLNEAVYIIDTKKESTVNFFKSLNLYNQR